MSIYATLWSLKFPHDGDEYPGCDWIEVIAQAVPPHIGSPTPGEGYEDGCMTLTREDGTRQELGPVPGNDPGHS